MNRRKSLLQPKPETRKKMKSEIYNISSCVCDLGWTFSNREEFYEISEIFRTEDERLFDASYDEIVEALETADRFDFSFLNFRGEAKEWPPNKLTVRKESK
jgi:hypothetical protein